MSIKYATAAIRLPGEQVKQARETAVRAMEAGKGYLDAGMEAINKVEDVTADAGGLLESNLNKVLPTNSTPHRSKLVKSPLWRGIGRSVSDAREGKFLSSRFKLKTHPQDAPFLSRAISTMAREKVKKWDTQLQEAMPAAGGKPFVFDPRSKGSLGTYRRINDYRRRLTDPVYARAHNDRTAAEEARQASLAVQRRMKKHLSRFTRDRTQLDMSDPTQRIQAGPDFMHENPVFNNAQQRTVWGMRPTTINNAINMAGKAIGLPMLTSSYGSRMPSLYPAGNRNAPVSDMQRMGMGNYLNALQGPSQATSRLIGPAAQFIR